MTQGDMVRMIKWRNRFCTEDPPNLFTVVDIENYGGGDSVSGSASSQSRRLQGGSGRQSQWTQYQTVRLLPPVVFKEETPPPSPSAYT